MNAMLKYLKVNKETGAKQSSSENHNWLLLDQNSLEESLGILKNYKLPDDIFLSADSLGEVARIEPLSDTALTNATSLVFFNLSDERSTIESRIEPISFVTSDDLLITYVGKNSGLIDDLIRKQAQELTSFENIILLTISRIYTHFIAELKEIKEEIDALDANARNTTGKTELFKLADIDRKVIFIDHTLQDQEAILNQLWQDETFTSKINSPSSIFDIKLQQAQALKLIKVYHELVDTLGTLFESMISNNLNHLMKYLESAALVLTVPTLIAGVWGMNTGGLPFKDQIFGSLILFAVMLVLTILTALYLAKKNYFK